MDRRHDLDFSFTLLICGEVCQSFQQAPARLRQDRFVSVSLRAPGLGGADVVERPGTLFANDPQVGIPPIRADEFDRRRHPRYCPTAGIAAIFRSGQSVGWARKKIFRQGEDWLSSSRPSSFTSSRPGCPTSTICGCSVERLSAQKTRRRTTCSKRNPRGWRPADPKRLGRRAAILRLHLSEVLPFPHSDQALRLLVSHRFF